MPLTLSSYCNRSRDVLGTVSMTTPFNRSQLGPLLPSETVDKLEMDCLNSVRVRADHPPLTPPHLVRPERVLLWSFLST